MTEKAQKMTISELIAKLEQLKLEHGDLPVCLYNMRWENYETNLTVSALDPWISKRTGKVEDFLENRKYVWIDFG